LLFSVVVQYRIDIKKFCYVQSLFSIIVLYRIDIKKQGFIQIMLFFTYFQNPRHPPEVFTKLCHLKKKNSLANSTSKYSNTQSLLSLSVSSFNFRSPHFVVLCSTRTQNFHRYSSFARLAHSADLGAAIFKTRCPKCNAN
jgi:hypothetical protein